MEEKSDRIPRDVLYVAHGGNSHQVPQAVSIEAHKPRHHKLVDEVESKLDATKLELRQQALHKEKVLRENLALLSSRIDWFKEKLDAEVQKKRAACEELKAGFVRPKDDLETQFKEALKNSSAVVSNDWIPTQEKAIEKWRANFDNFIEVTVPATIEKQSGRVTRHLIKSQERFDIENTKLVKREKKIVQRFENHAENVSLCLKEMQRKRRLCFIMQEEDIVQEERDADRLEENSQTRLVQRVKGVKDMKGGLAGVRKDTDAEILRSIEEAMTRLQQNVLKNFGGSTRVKPNKKPAS